MNREIKLQKGWYMKMVEDSDQTGLESSGPDFSPSGWHSCELPTTILGALSNSGDIADPFFGSNLKAIDSTPYLQPWWFQHTFEFSGLAEDENLLLDFEGINHKANIWLNQELIYSSSDEGPFRQLQLNIRTTIRTGSNNLLIQVFPPKPGDFNIGFVDWNPGPPDQSMGIFRNIILRRVGPLSISSPFIDTLEIDHNHRARLVLHCLVTNHSNESQKGILSAKFDGRTINIEIDIAPGEKRQISHSTAENASLDVKDAKLWWPYQLGKPHLYDLKLQVNVDGRPSDETTTKFGIRTTTDYITEEGHRGYKINNTEILIKGAGWADDIFLRDTDQSIKQQLDYVKHMNLNCIRLEGFWGKEQTMYDLCDEMGILMMVGWSCHWEHEQYLGKPIDERFGGVQSKDDRNLIAQSFQDQVLWLRHHPSIFVWTLASDRVPHTQLEQSYIDILGQYDNRRPTLNSTGGIGSEQGIVTTSEVVSEISGSSRVKMLGPYAYTPPVYWYTNQNLGGAYGFNTETCPGANIPIEESLRRMLPAEDYWPVNEMWNIHCGLNSFSTISRIEEAIEKRYGAAENLENFAMKAQLLNYELMRPMFEAFQAHRPRSTGVIQWMLNSAWTSMYWQLYDAYLNPTAAFYAARKACEPLHLIYNYGTSTVMLINEHLRSTKGWKAVIRLFDIESEVILKREISLSDNLNYSTQIFNPWESTNRPPLSFLDLQLFDLQGKEITTNFYWLAAFEDELDYEAEFEDWPFYTPTKTFADYRSLGSLASARLSENISAKSDGSKIEIEIGLENRTNVIAFFTSIAILDRKTGHSILPTLLDDNYFSVIPKERKTVRATIYTGRYLPSDIEVVVSGWNISKQIHNLLLSG